MRKAISEAILFGKSEYVAEGGEPINLSFNTLEHKENE